VLQDGFHFLIKDGSSKARGRTLIDRASPETFTAGSPEASIRPQA
jgi:hypothetical protein